MTVFVEYRVPILVEVDERLGAVVSVRVDDDDVEGPLGVVAEHELSAANERRALAIAEAEPWPAWEFGI
jgi:hypothetical protein